MRLYYAICLYWTCQPMEAMIKTTSKAIVEAPTTTIKVVTIATKPRVVHSFEEVGATYAVICMVPIA